MKPNEALPENANWLTPYLTVADAKRSLAFYERAFGFAQGEVLSGKDGRIMHAGMIYQGKSILMFAPESAPSPKPMRTPAHSGIELPLSFYVYCPDVDAQAEQARRAEATILSEPEDMFWGDRMMTLLDPDGYIWSFATRVGEFDPSKMPK